eukprot:1632485-Rhodomonas_salina.4
MHPLFFLHGKDGFLCLISRSVPCTPDLCLGLRVRLRPAGCAGRARVWCAVHAALLCAVCCPPSPSQRSCRRTAASIPRRWQHRGRRGCSRAERARKDRAVTSDADRNFARKSHAHTART